MIENDNFELYIENGMSSWKLMTFLGLTNRLSTKNIQQGLVGYLCCLVLYGGQHQGRMGGALFGTAHITLGVKKCLWRIHYS